VLSDEIDNHPSTLTLLNMCEGEGGGLSAPQAATDENRKQRSIALAGKLRGVWRVDQPFRLSPVTPIPRTDSEPAGALYLSDSGSEIRRYQAIVCCFRDQSTHGGEPYVNRGCGKVSSFELCFVGVHDSLRNWRPGFGMIPG
jgi:hypothetical protein